MFARKLKLGFALMIVSVPLGQAADDAAAHWAFQPVANPAIPSVQGRAWLISPIDHFILRKLEANGLTPSPRANVRTLLRRAYLDLTGLPPTRDEVTSFESEAAADSQGALRRWIDRLLASPAYGERWGRHWLDVARYADAKGYVDAGEPKYPFAYTYRDYVIRAFNEDMPYDQFILEQIAADRLGSDDPRPLAALGFLTVGSRYNFFPHEIIDDRIDVVTRGLLGLTAGCARCHDHKYDPIPIEDYYSLYGIFASSREPTPDQFPKLPGQADEDAAFQAKLKETAGKYNALRAKLHKQIQHELRAWAGDYLRYIVQTSPAHRTQSQPEIRTERGLIREVAAYSSGGVIRWRQFLGAKQSNDSVLGLWRRLFDLNRDEIQARFIAEWSAWKTGGNANPIVLAAFENKMIESMADVADVYGELLEGIETDWQAQLKETPEATGFADTNREQLRQALYIAGSPAVMTVDESEDLYTLDESTEVRKHFAEIERVFLAKGDQVAPRPMIMEDRAKPAVQRVFLRGDAKQLGKPATRHVPAVYSGGQARKIQNGSGRLALAKAITHPGNPLTVRVIVNRVWAWHFGRGLVITPSDFGVRSTEPSHPELLDFMATWFVQNDWSLKKLNRLILLSSTWQQASIDRPTHRAADPENRFLWRMNRRRLGFEAMRDSMLYVAGQMEHRAGGQPLDRRPDDTENR
ncbi:MAG TPA: DUF1549 and DUF1553 domain-containing protein, partial [Verrucomicrobiota bacterium]|nr:DUF1549 and DUF1553 domain-containing protein [Verrucomicrobiota bacterium]